MDTHVQADRAQREQQFHDARFTDETRTGEAKYYAALEPAFLRYWELIDDRSVGCDVLEYGCADGANSLRLAARARSITGIDISPVAISRANARAVAERRGNVSFVAMNAEKMTFADAQFDLVFGSGILHHLDFSQALSELKRVVKPGGSCVFVEPLGHNLLINLYRRWTPAVRTPDEHPLLRQDFKLASTYFKSVCTEHFALSEIGAVALGGTRLKNAATACTRRFDRALLKLPGLKWQAWSVVAVLGR